MNEAAGRKVARRPYAYGQIRGQRYRRKMSGNAEKRDVHWKKSYPACRTISRELCV